MLPHFLPSFSLRQVRSASPRLRFSSHIKQEHSPPSEELGELIKAYSGMRLMPVVRGIVQTLSGVQFSHPSKRRMTVNLSRCGEERLGKATEKMKGGRMVLLWKREEKSHSCIA